MSCVQKFWFQLNMIFAKYHCLLSWVELNYNQINTDMNFLESSQAGRYKGHHFPQVPTRELFYKLRLHNFASCLVYSIIQLRPKWTGKHYLEQPLCTEYADIEQRRRSRKLYIVEADAALRRTPGWRHHRDLDGGDVSPDDVFLSDQECHGRFRTSLPPQYPCVAVVVFVHQSRWRHRRCQASVRRREASRRALGRMCRTPSRQLWRWRCWRW